MVFIELKSKYVNDVMRLTPGLINFITYLFHSEKADQEIEDASPADFNSITVDVDNLIRILLSKDNNSFNLFCEEYQRKAPDENSSWINNNYLIYLIIVGSFQHKADLRWLKSVLQLRKTENEEACFVKDILLSVVTGQIAKNIAPFAISFFWLGQKKDHFNQFAFLAKDALASTTTFPTYNDEFLNLLLIHSFTVLLQNSSIVNLDKSRNIELFKSLGSYFLLKYIFRIVPQSTKDWILIFLSLLGFTGLEVLKGRKSVAKCISLRLNKYFGKTLLEN
jgi:hypothetical protein